MQTRWPLDVACLTLLLVSSVVLNVVQLRHATRLSTQVSILVRSLTFGRELPPAPGDSVPDLTAEDEHGQPIRILVKNTPLPTVLYFFSSTCGWCERNLGNFRALTTAGAGSYRFIAVSLGPEDLKAYAARSGLRCLFVRRPNRESRLAYGMATTPTTILVDTTGVVEGVWRGAYAGDTLRDIERVFRVQLPGIGGLPAGQSANR